MDVISILHRLSLVLGSTLDRDQETRVYLDWLKSELNPHLAFLFISDDQRQNLHLCAAHGVHLPAERRLPFGASPWDWLKNQGVRFQQYRKAQRYALPVMIEGELYGMLVGVSSASGETLQQERHLLDLSLAYLGPVLRNIERYQNIEKQVIERTKQLSESEARFRALAETTATAIFVYNEGGFQYVNRAAEQLSGYAASELCAMRFWDVVHPEHKELVRQRGLARLRGERVPDRYEFKILRKDGTERWLDFTSGKIEWEGKPAVIGSAFDITDRKLTELALRESEAKLKQAQAAGRLGFWEFDLQTQSIYWSEETYKLYERDPSLGAPSDTEKAGYYSPQQAAQLREYARRAIEEGVSFAYDLEMRLPSGREAYYTATMYPYKDVNGQVRKLFGTIQDITARKRREREIEAQAMLAKALAESLDLENLLAKILAAARYAIPAADKGSILLADEEGNLHVEAVIGYQDERVRTASFPVHAGYSARAFRTRQALIIPDARSDDEIRYDGEIEEMRQVQSAIAVPLIVQERVIGVLALDNIRVNNAFSDRDVPIVSNIASVAALAIQNARLFAETQHQLNEISAIQALGQALSSTLNLNELYRIAYQHVRDLVGCDNFSISLYDEKTQTLHASFVLSEGEELDAGLFPPLKMDVHNPLEGRAKAIFTAQPAFVHHLHQKSRQAGGLLIGSATEPKSAVYIPMLVEGHVIGLMELQSYRDEAYQPKDSGLMNMIATQIGLAIQNARLYTETSQKAEEKAAFLDASLALNNLDLDYILHTVGEKAKTLFQADDCRIFLIDEDSDTVRCVLSFDENAEAIYRSVLKIGEGIVGNAIKKVQAEIINEVMQDPRAIQVDGTEDRPERMMVVPLLTAEKVIGAMEIVRTGETRAFIQDDLELLTSFASMTSVAVFNAHLYQQTNRRLAQLETVHRVTLALRSAQKVEEALPIMLDEALHGLSAEAGSIMLYSPSDGQLKTVTARGWFSQIGEQTLKPMEGIAGTVFASGRSYISLDFSQDPLAKKPQNGELPAGWGGACVPIRGKEDILGVLFISVPLPRRIQPEEVNLLESLAEIAATTLLRMRLYEDTLRRVKQLQALQIIDRAITSSLDMHLTLNLLLEQSLEPLEADAADVLLYDANFMRLNLVTSRGFRDRKLDSFDLGLGQDAVGKCVSERRPIHVFSLKTYPNFPQRNELFQQEEFLSYVGIPLIAKGQIKGALEVFFRRYFNPDPDWMEFFQGIAQQAALAIDNAQMFSELERSHFELSIAYDATILGWSNALDLRDKETEGHSQRVTDLTVQIAKAMGISEEKIVHIRRGALLHDIGKMGVPDHILFKPGPLDEEEWKIMRQHPQYALDMLSPIAYLKPALDIPFCHHERWDGSGYPRGLKGEEIPIAARIFAVADVYDALTSDRPYRKALSHQQAVDYIRQQRGIQFDPKVVDVFLRIIENNPNET
jgi:PAS domain S-box-containing protein